MTKFIYLLFGLGLIFFGLLSFLVSLAYEDMTGVGVVTGTGLISAVLGARLVLVFVRRLKPSADKKR